MKILLLNTYDIEGGAARAAYRLNNGLRLLGNDAKMMVGIKRSDDINVISPTTNIGRSIALLSPYLDALPLLFYRNRTKHRTLFSAAFLPENKVRKIHLYDPDIIHLHWIVGGFLRIETLRKFRKPIIWTLHDMWAFTGGCHYDDNCGRYEKSCGYCPQLKSKKQNDLSRLIWKRKRKVLKYLNLTIVTPSLWLAKCAEKSSLFGNLRIQVIPNGIDTKIYKPIEKSIARERFGLPNEKKLILFGAINALDDERKGFYFFQKALEKLSHQNLSDKIEIVLFGASEPINPPDMRFKVHYIGKLHDDISLSLLYAATDIFVLPSIQENLPNTIMESMACGTPCVAFKTGGIPEMIEHESDGYLARPSDPDDIAKGIAWILEDSERSHFLAQQARKKVEKEFDLKVVAKRYTDLYGDILSNKKH